MKIIADNTIPFLKGVIESLGEIEYLASGQFTADAVKDADALIVRSVDKCTRNILEGSRVKLITTATIGFDHIDTAYCDQAGIVWKNAPGCNAQSVAEYLLACLVTHAMRYDYSLEGKTLGIVGVGHVGKKIARLCPLLGMKVLLNDPPRADEEGSEGFVSLETIAEEADIITFHTPLTKEGSYPTWHLADDDFIKKLKRKPLLINACRGAVFDTSAILAGVDSGYIGSLIIDCWEKEPNISLELLQQTAIATPHIAGFSADGKSNATRMCLEAISDFFNVDVPDIHKVTPPAPEQPIVDMDLFPSQRMEHAILNSFNPVTVDRSLRDTPERFEWFRANYDHPREFAAYTLSHLKPEEIQLARNLGFNYEE